MRRTVTVACTASVLLGVTLAACSPRNNTDGTTVTGTSGPTPSSISTPGNGSVGTPLDVASGLQTPWSIAFVEETALVSERNSGRIRAA
ncbi:hypothetical protein EJK15_55230 [Nonomuraea basaltis]|nr:hypothetical protein EJK15_55230 [Nonomuraea basaltis]